MILTDVYIPLWPSITFIIWQAFSFSSVLIVLGIYLKTEDKEKIKSLLISILVSLVTYFLIYKGGFFIPLFGANFH